MASPILGSITSAFGSVAGIISSKNQRKTAEAQRDAVVHRSKADEKIQELKNVSSFTNNLFGLQQSKYRLASEKLAIEKAKVEANSGSGKATNLVLLTVLFVLILLLLAAFIGYKMMKSRSGSSTSSSTSSSSSSKNS